MGIVECARPLREVKKAALEDVISHRPLGSYMIASFSPKVDRSNQPHIPYASFFSRYELQEAHLDGALCIGGLCQSPKTFLMNTYRDKRDGNQTAAALHKLRKVASLRAPYVCRLIFPPLKRSKPFSWRLPAS